MTHDRETGNRRSFASRRRRLLATATAVAGGTAAAAATVPFLASLLPSERAKSAGAPVEADVGRLRPGELLTVEWRGKPVWMLRRTDDMLKTLGMHDGLLLDPRSARSQQPAHARNATRSQRPELFVSIALCTHLGCIPSYRKERAAPDLGPQWPGGFFCPCHGSKFDLAGRVFRNVPAPTNLEIPPHVFLSETRLLIGENPQSAAF